MLWINICKINKIEIQKKKLFLSRSIFWPFFGIFLCLNIANIQGLPEISFVSQLAWTSCQRLRATCGPVPEFSQASITDALISPTTPAKRIRLHFIQPESKRPLKSRIGQLYSGHKIEHTFTAVRALRSGSCQLHRGTTKRAGNGYI